MHSRLGEVLEAKHLAEAALHHAKVTKAANETHADCLRIIIRADTRLADEIDKGQAEGEIATQSAGGANIGARPSGTAAVDETIRRTLKELGVTSQRLSEWRTVRDAGESVVEEAISQAQAEDRPPTKSDILRKSRQTIEVPVTVKPAQTAPQIVRVVTKAATPAATVIHSAASLQTMEAEKLAAELTNFIRDWRDKLQRSFWQERPSGVAKATLKRVIKDAEAWLGIEHDKLGK
jgi:hypothetical protein